MNHPLTPILEEGWEIVHIDNKQYINVNSVHVTLETVSDAAYQGINILRELKDNESF